jgi:multicomponent Na+:H+ antiporter subunit B
MSALIIDLVLFTLLVAVAIQIVRLDHLFVVTMLSGVFSLLTASLFITLDAPDVAFTEAAVGAGISTVLMLGTLALTSQIQKPSKRTQIVPLLVVVATGMALIYSTFDMPAFGDPQAPSQTHVGPYYITKTPEEIDVPNIVTAVLASYRGFDTLGEVVVVFMAGVGVLALLGHKPMRRAVAARAQAANRREEDE